MAERFDVIWGGGTGGTEEFGYVSGGTVQSTNKEQDTHSAEFADQTEFLGNTVTSYTGDDIKIALRVWISAAPSSSIPILYLCEASTTGTNASFRLQLNTGRTLSLVDAGGSVTATTTDTIATSTWTTVEVLVRVADSGSASVRIDGGTPTTDSSGDYLNGAAGDYTGVVFRGVAGATMRLDRFYVYAGETTDSVTISSGVDGDFAVKTYQPGSGSTANNTGLPGGDAHTLEGGTVADWDDRPIVEEATTPKITDNDSVAYECDASGGNQYNGPNGDSDINTVVAAKYMLWALRGNGGGTTHTLYGGNSGDGLSSVASLSLGTSFALHEAITTSASIMPTASEDAAIGFGVSGARDMEVTEAFVTVLSDVAAGGGASINVPNGSLSVTGVTPTLDFGSWPSNASLALTGIAPTAIVDTNIDVPFGALALTGVAPLAGQNVSRTIPSASMTLAGQAISLDTGLYPAPDGLTLAGQSMILDTGFLPDPASLTLTGVTPTLDLGINPDPGSMTLTGIAPTADLTTGLTILVPSASLTIGGQTVALDLGINPDPGVLTLTGIAPQLSVPLDLSIDPASLTLTGVTVQLDRGYPVPSAALSLTGIAPNSVVNTIRIPGVGALSVTGIAPMLGFEFFVPSSALNLTGIAPDFVNSGDTDVSADVPFGSLVLSGQGLRLGHGLGIPSSGMDLAGIAPTLDFQINVGNAALSLTGLAPTIEIDLQRLIGAAVLTLTGATVVIGYGTPVPFGAMSLGSVAPTVTVISSSVHITSSSTSGGISRGTTTADSRGVTDIDSRGVS